MATTESQASWHPAFMPNSVSDIAPANQYINKYSSLSPSTSSIKQAEAIEETPRSILSHPSESGRDVPSDIYYDRSKELTQTSDNVDHSELVKLRSALTTSLASPGGVEMDENPLHADSSIGGEFRDTLDGSVNPGKAEFPSERPGHEPGHASSASFARTVPRDMDWGEDDDVDPEWNLQRVETDPFKLMPKSERTNSFPQVPPMHNPGQPIIGNPLPSSQSGDIFRKAEQSRTLFSPNDTPGDFFSRENEGTAISPTDVRHPSENIFREEITGDKDYGLAYGGEIPDKLEAEARFEEGLPLMEDSEPDESSIPMKEDSGTALFADDGHGEEEDFFGGLAGSEDPNFMPHLGRKSTMQVMDGFDFPSPEETSESPVDVFGTGGYQNRIDNATGGGIAVSRSTVLSQVLGDARNSTSSQDENQNFPSQEPSAEDLAAKWQAALAGDDLLDDDELLDEDSIPQTGGVDPRALFGSDDEGFLDDDETMPELSTANQQISSLPMPVLGNDGQAIGFDNLTSSAFPLSNNPVSRYLPANATQTSVQQQPSNTFTPQAPLFTDLSQQPSQSGFNNATGFGAGTVALPPSYGAPQSSRPEAIKSQSFADKSKGGYSSPYDLPMEVVKPRKRASMQQMARGYSIAPPPASIPPPRSSSMVAQGPPPSRGSTSSLSPPVYSPALHQTGVKPPQLLAVTAQQTSSPSLNSQSSFFAELPMGSRPKPAGRYSPQPSPALGRDQGAQIMPPAFQHPQAPVSQSVPIVQGLVAPPKVSPFAPLQASHSQPPVVTSRYSPAPPPRSGTGSAPPPSAHSSRYTTAPPPQLQQSSSYTPAAPVTSPPAPILAHQPRTSSPLVHFERAPDQRSVSGSTIEASTVSMLRRESSGFDSVPRAYASQGRMSPSKRATSSYAPDPRSTSLHQEPVFAPPQRSQTQSPGSFMASSRADISVGEPYQRPVSVHSPTSPRKNNESFHPISAALPKPRARGFTQTVNYVAPTDGREHDPLQRWRGGPVFAWGVGTVVTSFPREVPRYGMGQTIPMMICGPGEVKVRSLKDILPLEERLASFPGPLKGKSKKKEVIAWLTAGIEILEREALGFNSLATFMHEDKRREERLLLWKILRVMIENDGLLEGNPVVDKAVRGVLSPGFDSEDNAAAPQYTTASDIAGALRGTSSSILPEPLDPTAVDQLRKYLLRGEREKAVWEAVDKRLWAHALLISNTLPREIHKQVAQEFIQKEVKGVSENTESLAALYEIFAGNYEESVDELVPPSARAGLQMVSASGNSGSSKSALDGLDRWRETLGLVLSNRSPEDVQAISALGKLLSGYGRAEAAHICFLFARGYSVFGGVDDPLSNIVLVGSDHLRQPYEFDRELEPTLLSEVYEYGISLSATSNVAFSAPHLAVYKLQHASILAQFGQRDKALQYCEAIGNSISSQVRRSPYHNAQLISALDDLSKRLKQSPKDESSSWIPKPSIDKVSGSLWGKFNKFVAGDEDGASGGAGSEAGSDVGPFARIAGDTPIISRSPSNADIYGSVNAAPPNGMVPHLAAMKPASRYAPGGTYTPPDPSLSTSYGSPPRSYAPRRSHEETARPEIYGYDRTSFTHQPSINDQASRSYPGSESSLPSNSYGQSSSPYLGSTFPPHLPAPPVHDQYTSLNAQSSPLSIPASDNNVPSMGYIPASPNVYEQTSQTYEAPSSGGYEPISSQEFEPPSSGGYEPPTSGGYEPPSYEPASMNDEPDSPIDTRPKKKSFMDDDDDEPTSARTSQNGKPENSKVEKSKAQKDREADEAFRKAAEADAKKDTSAPAKKGWGLGGWFSKKEAAIDGAQPNKPIRAKLGEESSFVYDPDLKRWVNKKAGKDGAQDTPSAMPPPPKAGPPRSVSGTPAMEPSSGPRAMTASAPPQRAVSAMVTSTSYEGTPALALPPSLAPPMSRSISNGSATGPPSGPPSRPTTSTSNASSIDDLLGPPMARKGGAGAKKAKKGRGYIDVMEKPSGK